MPQTKIIVLTSHTEKIVIDQIIEKANPEGIMLKSDVNSEDFLNAFALILKGEKYYSVTVLKYLEKAPVEAKRLDSYNQQIIILLSKGAKLKPSKNNFVCLKVPWIKEKWL